MARLKPKQGTTCHQQAGRGAERAAASVSTPLSPSHHHHHPFHPYISMDAYLVFIRTLHVSSCLKQLTQHQHQHQLLLLLLAIFRVGSCCSSSFTAFWCLQHWSPTLIIIIFIITLSFIIIIIFIIITVFIVILL